MTAAGISSTFCYALDCRVGGLVTQCHNEIFGALGNIGAMVYSEVIREPIVRESQDEEGVSALIADLSLRGVWQPQTVALFNICVVDTDTLSHVNCPVEAVLFSTEAEKKMEYLEDAEAHAPSLIYHLYVQTVDGVFGSVAEFFSENIG